MTTHRRLAATLTLTALLTGCAAHTPTQPAAPSEAPTSTPAAPIDLNNACTLLSPEAVGKLLGIDDVTSAPQPPRTASNGIVVHTCDYQRRSTPDRFIGELGVSTAVTPVTPAQITGIWLQRIPNTRPVPGVGDAAVYSLDQKTKTAVLRAAKTTHGITVLVTYGASAQLTPEQLAALVKQAIDTM